ncbi:B3 domain-containing transcription factor NGA4-like [Durio zibethinus]|uniref:B3 domain-containing transcription factor NGA4-like n=1 Tax=Durio zibethinus TaxID=66656 RepID=A0A6P5YNL7_DURZI|nr:B3 domain-containing transcription factor NGA4-like [Durio zibethinus]
MDSKAIRNQAKKRRVLFSKRLTGTDIMKRLAIPTESLAFLPRFCGGHALELLVRDENGKCWTFVCSIRKTGAYQKPVFQQGWQDFVVAKCLNVGDKVTFYEAEEAEDGIKIFGSILPHSRHRVEIVRKRVSPTPRASHHLG